MSDRLLLKDLIHNWTRKKNKVLTPHMFRRGRLTQLFLSKTLTKDQLASFVDHNDLRSLPHYLPKDSESFLDTIQDFDKGQIDPLISNLRESNLKALMKEAFKEAMKEERIPISI